MAEKGKERSLVVQFSELQKKIDFMEKRISEIEGRKSGDGNCNGKEYFDNKFLELKSCIITALSINGIKNIQFEKMITDEAFVENPQHY